MGNKTRAYGADAQLLGAFESTYGTPLDGSGGGVYSLLSFKSSALGAEKDLGYDPLLGQGRDAQDPYYEAEMADGDIDIPFDLRAIGFWLKGLFGAPVTTGTGPYTHVFTSGGDLPSMTLEVGHTKLTTPKYYPYPGVKLGTLAFEMARTGPVNGTIGTIAQGGAASSSSPKDADPITYALKRFNQSKGAIKVGGSQLANVTGGRLSFNNNLERVETIRADGLIDGADETEATADGSIDVRFSTDTTLSTAIDAETPVAMDFEYSIAGAEGYKLAFALPRVFLPKKKIEIPGPGGLQASYDWRAAKDPTEGYMLQVTLINDVASY